MNTMPDNQKGHLQKEHLQKGHLLDSLLANYALGILSCPLHAVVSSHLDISPVNRSFVATLESLYGSLMASSEVAPITNRAAKLRAIFDDEPVQQDIYTVHLKSENKNLYRQENSVFPMPLKKYLQKDINDIKWRSLLPGIKEYEIEHTEEGEAKLYWISAGRHMPSHTHEGMETTLILKGAFRDGQGFYKRGDISIADPEIDHRPVADTGEDCVCFAVTDAPLKLTGPIGRIFEYFKTH